jgi:hypothetical protein
MMGLVKVMKKLKVHYLANRSHTDCSRFHRIAERREQTSDLSIVPIFSRIEIESISGLKGVPERAR